MTAPPGEGKRHHTAAATACRHLTYDWSAVTLCVEAEQVNYRVDYVTRPVRMVARLIGSPRDARPRGRPRRREHRPACPTPCHRPPPRRSSKRSGRALRITAARRGATNPSGLLQRDTPLKQVRPAEHVDQRLASLIWQARRRCHLEAQAKWRLDSRTGAGNLADAGLVRGLVVEHVEHFGAPKDPSTGPLSIIVVPAMSQPTSSRSLIKGLRISRRKERRSASRQRPTTAHDDRGRTTGVTRRTLRRARRR